MYFWRKIEIGIGKQPMRQIRRFRIHYKEESTMVSYWTDALYCWGDADGSISLQLHKYDYEDSNWLPPIEGIRTPSQFADAFAGIHWIDHWGLNELIPNLRKKMPIFSLLLEIEMDKARGVIDLDFDYDETLTSILRHAIFEFPHRWSARKNMVLEASKFAFDHFDRKKSPPTGEVSVLGARVQFQSLQT